MTEAVALIRRARPGEADALTALCRRAKAHWGYSADQIARWRDELTVHADVLATHPAWVAERDGRAIGYCLLRAGEPYWCLEDLFVDPAAIGQGVGRGLMAVALTAARDGGARGLAIDADPHAEPFYLAQGARRVGTCAAPIPGEPARVRPQLLIGG
ncbi:MAG: GNAT family N-acetyltransferase [Burkholderiaceae bacterium]